MSDTLGSLCDKLTIIKLKQFHSNDSKRLESLKQQQQQLIEEIDEYVTDSVSGKIPLSRMVFQSNKVYSHAGNEIETIKGSIGIIFDRLTEINCLLWHEQEKVYEFEKVAVSEKDKVVKQLAVLNLERTNCIDEINNCFAELIECKAVKER